MDRFEDMRCFVQVVDRGSVTKAADALRVAPSAVSRRIKELEARLGTQLLIRTTRRMSLTEAGRTFHARCQRVLADLDEAEAEASDRHGALKGSLRPEIDSVGERQASRERERLRREFDRLSRSGGGHRVLKREVTRSPDRDPHAGRFGDADPIRGW